MYKAFYGFQEKPFTLTPDPAFLYLSKQHEMALTMLNYGLQSEAGISVITGDVGAGKTTLIREILQNSLDSNTQVGLISNSHSSFGDLLEWVLRAFDISTDVQEKSERYKVLMDFLINNYANNQKNILIIDEAQNMDAATLEELRLISNINADKHLVLQLILVGQPELLELMQKHELRQLAQRVSVDYKLTGLGYKETVSYIRHRLIVAGGSEAIFDKYAMAAIYFHSGGVPRLINTLCDFSLVVGFSEEMEKIDIEVVLDVMKEKLLGGIFPAVKKENKEQSRVRELIQQAKGIDIQKILDDSNDSELLEL